MKIVGQCLYTPTTYIHELRTSFVLCVCWHKVTTDHPLTAQRTDIVVPCLQNEYGCCTIQGLLMYFRGQSIMVQVHLDHFLVSWQPLSKLLRKRKSISHYCSAYCWRGCLFFDWNPSFVFSLLCVLRSGYCSAEAIVNTSGHRHSDIIHVYTVVLHTWYNIAQQ